MKKVFTKEQKIVNVTERENFNLRAASKRTIELVNLLDANMLQRCHSLF